MDQKPVHDRPMKVYFICYLGDRTDKETDAFTAIGQATLPNSVHLKSILDEMVEEEAEVEVVEAGAGAEAAEIETEEIIKIEGQEGHEEKEAEAEAEAKVLLHIGKAEAIEDLDLETILLTTIEEDKTTEETDIDAQNQDKGQDRTRMMTDHTAAEVNINIP